MKKVKIEIEVSYFAYKVKEYRLKSKLQQEDLAKKLKCSRASIANIEAGRQDPSYDKLYELCKIFKCSSTDLLGF